VEVHQGLEVELLLVVRLQRVERLHVLDALLQHHNVMRVFLAGHVYAKVPGHVRLVIAHLAPERGLGLLVDHRAVHGRMVLAAARRSRAHGRRLFRRVLGRRRRLVPLHLGAGHAAVLQLLHVVQMLVGLHVYAEVAFGGRRIVAHLTPVRFVTARVRLAPGQPRVRLPGDAVHARRFRLGVFLLHVYLQRLLVFVMPVAFRALERLARVPGVHADQRAAHATQPGRTQYELAPRAVHAAGPAVHVVGTHADRGARHEVGRRLRVRQRGARHELRAECGSRGRAGARRRAVAPSRRARRHGQRGYRTLSGQVHYAIVHVRPAGGGGDGFITTIIIIVFTYTKRVNIISRTTAGLR